MDINEYYPHIFSLAKLYGIDVHSDSYSSYTIHDIAQLAFQIDRISLQDIPGCIEKLIVLKSLRYSFYSILSTVEINEYKDNSNYNDDIEKEVEFAHKYYSKQLPYMDIANALENVMKTNIDTKKIALLLTFAQRTEMLLQYGGDDRLTLDIKSSKLNKYFSTTFPRVKVLRRGSCTCSTISLDTYLEADMKKIKLLKLSISNGDIDQLMEDECHTLRSRILQVLQLKEIESEIVLFPSGSDAEFLPLLIAISRTIAKTTLHSKSKVFNYVIAAGEVGSGTPNAATGKHFSPLSPKGYEQKNNETLKGIDEEMIETISYKPRSKSGVADFLENEIMMDISEKLKRFESSVAVLHLVVSSKTGLIYPSMKTINTLKELYNDRIIVTVDACQLRCRLDIVREYIQQNFVVLITGSKFYTGPPFSGAVVIPQQSKIELENLFSSFNNSLTKSGPVGIQDYLTKCDIPSTLPQMKKFLCNDWYNAGLLLRWHCALPIMEAYRKLDPNLVLQLTKSWIDHVKTKLKLHKEYLKIIEVTEGIDDNIILGNSNTIISVAICKRDNAFLNVDELKEFHSKMTQSLRIDNDLNNYCEYEVMLGQPVKLADSGFGVVRIALGADMVVNAFGKDGTTSMQQAMNINKIFNDDTIVISKMAMLSRYWDNIVSKKSYGLCSKFSEINRALCFSEKDIQESSSATPLTIEKISAFLKCLEDIPENMIVYDIDSFISSIQNLKTAFDNQKKTPEQRCSFLHCFAIKSCPLSYILHVAISCGLGLEAASIVEVKQALRCGCLASKIMFDSPCKSSDDLYFAIKHGVNINANTVEEVERISAVIHQLQKEGYEISSTIGLRINPLVGAGSISALSTATNDSKFGVPVVAQKNIAFRSGRSAEEIVEIFVQNKFLTAIMCHVGSQGMPLEFMVEGACKIVNLADSIDAAIGRNHISFIDIGGGLTTNYKDDAVKPTFEDYALKLCTDCPGLFQKERTVITEFGKSLIAKSGAIVTVIEDMIYSFNNNAELSIAITHAGADLMLRTAYCPEKFSHRLELLSNRGEILHDRKRCMVTVAGPLCFSGDVIASNIDFLDCNAGDRVVVLDAGANTLSLHSRHCSRLAPDVYAFRTVPKTLHSLIKQKETAEYALQFWD